MKKETDGIVEDNHMTHTPRQKNVSLSSQGSRALHFKNTSGSGFASTLSSAASSLSSPTIQLFACPNTIGMSQYVSASSLRHASPHFSFTKGERFPELIITNNGGKSEKIYLPGSTTMQRSCSFGLGKKEFLPQHVMRNAKEYPSPNHYQQLEQKMGKSKSFGIPYKYFSKTYIPGNKDQCIEFAKEFPGVGQYEIMREPGDNKLKYSLQGKSKVKDYNQGFPAANVYNPIYKLEENARFTALSFGKGNKFDFTKQNQYVPGPGTYKLPSLFEQIAKFRRQQSRKTAFI